jgi:hypothetical protein
MYGYRRANRVHSPETVTAARSATHAWDEQLLPVKTEDRESDMSTNSEQVATYRAGIGPSALGDETGSKPSSQCGA